MSAAINLSAVGTSMQFVIAMTLNCDVFSLSSFPSPTNPWPVNFTISSDLE